ncbi:MAG: cysteine hydrolase [Clostridia bacterium]|nr:cysteine hydrolase [Clostridia bacterium]
MFRKLLIVVDMQKDFVDGALGTPEAQKIVPAVCEKIRSFDGDIIFTKDTHSSLYMDTQEGKKLPVPHCIKGTDGWELYGDIRSLSQGYRVIEKPTFGSVELANAVTGGNYSEVEFIGLCTDICVISNAMMIKAFLPEIPVSVDSSCCAGVTPESHENALKSMQMCQIDIK